MNRTDPDMSSVYLVRCADGTLYCGWTTDVEKRLETHNSGHGAKYTRSRLPVELVYLESFPDRRDAMRREWEIKQMTRADKLKLVTAYGESMKKNENEER